MSEADEEPVREGEEELQPWEPRPHEAQGSLAQPRRQMEPPAVPPASLEEKCDFLFNLRPLDSPAPYLEQLATIHLPRSGAAEPWRKLVVQPAVIPDLQHTGIRSDFTFQGQTFMRPDGQVTNELRNTVHERFNAIPKVDTLDPQDMQYVDMMRSIRRGGAFQSGAASVLRNPSIHEPSGPRQEMFEGAEASREAEDSLATESIVETELEESLVSREHGKPARGKRGKRRSPRKKKPCSEKALLECLLDLEYGNTDPRCVGEGDQEFRWDIDGFVNHLQ